MIVKGKQFLLLIRHPPCYSCIVNTTKSLGSDRGKKKSTYKVKDTLSFEIWIFRSGQPDHNDDRKIFTE